MLVPSTTPGSPPDQSDGEIDWDETGALTVEADVVVSSDAAESEGEEASEEADEADEDSVDGGSEDGVSEPGDEDDGEDGALDDGGQGLGDVPGVPGVPGALEAHGDGESEDGEVGGDTEGLAGFTGGGVLWSCFPVSPWWRPNQWPLWGS